MNRFELFWRNLWLAVRRAPRDRRALRFVLLWLGLLAYLVYLLWSWLYLGFWGTVFWFAAMALAVGIAVLIGRGNLRAGKSLISLSSKPDSQSEDYSGHRPKLAAYLMRTAVLVDRAAGEALHRRKKAGSTATGGMRRRTLDLARMPGLWEGFSGEEQELLMAPEGSWNWEQTWPRIAQVEDVRTLRWVIGIDKILVPFEFLQPDVTPAIEITTKPDRLAGTGCLPPWDLRPARTMAQEMVSRCIAEGVQRGFYTGGKEELRDEFLELAERMGEDESGDFLVGAKSVAKADKDRIQWIAQAALRRAYVLEGVIAYLCGGPEEELPIRGINVGDEDEAEQEGVSENHGGSSTLM